MIQAPPRRGLSGCEIAALCAISVASIPVALAALPGMSPARRQPMAIVFPPWVSAGEAITRSLSAGYPVLRSGRSSFVVIAGPIDGDALARKPEGAMLMLALDGLAGCLDVVAPEQAAS